jgi:Na+/proline symporter
VETFQLEARMKIMGTEGAYILLLAFSLLMILVTTLASRGHYWQTAVGFMAAGRRVPWWLGAISIAITWIWAPALFVSVQQAYQNGVPGIFWFTFPNIVSLLVIAPLAVRIRRYMPEGYTQPEWIRRRFDERTHKLYLIPFFWYQLMAVTVQLYAGGSIVALLTGVRIEIVMLILGMTTLIYSIISGMRASIITDFLQYALIIAAAVIVIPWTISAAGGVSSIVPGLGGITGKHTSIFDAQVAINFGIVTTIGLLSGSLADQQHWQRAFAIERKGLVRAYIVSGFLFGVVPIAVSLLGFLAANRSLGVVLPGGTDPSMVGVLTVAHFLPHWAVAGFLIMMLGGLCSTLDSGMCAASSLYALNWTTFSDREKYVRGRQLAGETLSDDERVIAQAVDKKIVRRGRSGMIGITIAGALVALAVLYIPGFGLQYLWWVFNTVAACVAVPTVLSLYWRRLDSRGVFWGVVVAFFVGIPLFVYSNIEGLTWLTIACSLGIVGITTLSCLLFPRKEPFPLPSSSMQGLEEARE